MKSFLMFLAALTLAPGAAAGAAGQNPPAEQAPESVDESHLRANVPDAKDFDNFLKRDLAAYFKGGREGTVAVEYELLRDGPTQTGVAYPKFYAWVKARKNGRLFAEGAARVAAVEKKRFEVTDFLSRADAARDPDRIYRIFPREVGDKIRRKVGGQTFAAGASHSSPPPSSGPHRRLPLAFPLLSSAAGDCVLRFTPF